MGASDYFGLLMLPSLYELLAREAPGIGVEVVPRPADGSLSRLIAGEVDLAVAVDPPEGRDLFNAPLVDERFVCVMRRDHPLARARLTVARLLDFPHVVVTAHGQSAALVDRALVVAGRRRQSPVSVPVFASAFALLAENDLLALLPERISRAQAGRFGLVLRKPPIDLPGYTLSIAWHQRTAHDAAHRWVREQLLAIAGPPAGHRRHQ